MKNIIYKITVPEDTAKKLELFLLFHTAKITKLKETIES